MGNPQSGPGARAAPAGRQNHCNCEGAGPGGSRDQTPAALAAGSALARGPRQGETRLGKGTRGRWPPDRITSGSSNVAKLVTPTSDH